MNQVVCNAVRSTETQRKKKQGVKWSGKPGSHTSKLSLSQIKHSGIGMFQDQVRYGKKVLMIEMAGDMQGQELNNRTRKF